MVDPSGNEYIYSMPSVSPFLWINKGAEEALLLNTQGAVACATIANVFVIRGDRLVTPPVAGGA